MGLVLGSTERLRSWVSGPLCCVSRARTTGSRQRAPPMLGCRSLVITALAFPCQTASPARVTPEHAQLRAIRRYDGVSVFVHPRTGIQEPAAGFGLHQDGSVCVAENEELEVGASCQKPERPRFLPLRSCRDDVLRSGAITEDSRQLSNTPEAQIRVNGVKRAAYDCAAGEPMKDSCADMSFDKAVAMAYVCVESRDADITPIRSKLCAELFTPERATPTVVIATRCRDGDPVIAETREKGQCWKDLPRDNRFVLEPEIKNISIEDQVVTQCRDNTKKVVEKCVGW